jgi:hypothetical protein
MSAFDYGTAESWDTSTETLLPVGNFVAEIVMAEPGHTKGSMGREAKPQLEIKVQNDRGSRKDWIVITPNTQGKVVQVFDASGTERPKQGEFDPSTGELTEEACARLRGKKVGVVIRDEQSLKDPTRMEPRIQGYVQPDRITEDVPIDTAGLPPANGPQSADSKIPF